MIVGYRWVFLRDEYASNKFHGERSKWQFSFIQVDSKYMTNCWALILSWSHMSGTLSFISSHTSSMSSNNKNENDFIIRIHTLNCLFVPYMVFKPNLTSFLRIALVKWKWHPLIFTFGKWNWKTLIDPISNSHDIISGFKTKLCSLAPSLSWVSIILYNSNVFPDKKAKNACNGQEFWIYHL